MKWNHRLIDLTNENNGEQLYAIQEVFYDDDGTPTSYGDPFMCGENMDEIHNLIDRLEEAVKQPILKPEDFKGAPHERPA